MGFVTKSFRYDTDDIVLDKFFKKQKNFTSAMKYLILNYCSTHPEIEDLSIKYKEATSYAMMDQIRKIEGEEAPAAPQEKETAAEPAAEQPDETPKAAAEPPAPTEKKKTAAKSRSTRKTKKATPPEDSDISTDYAEYM